MAPLPCLKGTKESAPNVPDDNDLVPAPVPPRNRKKARLASGPQDKPSAAAASPMGGAAGEGHIEKSRDDAAGSGPRASDKALASYHAKNDSCTGPRSSHSGSSSHEELSDLAAAADPSQGLSTSLGERQGSIVGDIPRALEGSSSTGHGHNQADLAAAAPHHASQVQQDPVIAPDLFRSIMALPPVEPALLEAVLSLPSEVLEALIAFRRAQDAVASFSFRQQEQGPRNQEK